jgi:hypothetical protein
MKIAVYGDSFACSDPRTKSFQWFMLLGEKIKADVVSFGLGATSLYYSYKKFQENHKNFDLNIVCVSHYQRYPTGIQVGASIEYPNSLVAVENILSRKNTSLSLEQIDFLNHLKGWYLVSDDEYMIDVQESFLQSMECMNENLVLLPSFDRNGSFTEERKKKRNIGERGSMIDFSHAQNKFWKDPNLDDLWQENFLRTACHYTPETNKLVAESVYNYIFNKQEFNAPELIEQEYERDYYYIRTKPCQKLNMI